MLLHELETLKKQTLNCSFSIAFAFEERDTLMRELNLHKAPQRHSLLLEKVGVAAPLPGETVSSWDFPQLSVLVLYLPTLHCLSESQKSCPFLHIGVDGGGLVQTKWHRATAECAGGLSMPGPVPCHHKSLLKIYGYYLSPLCACVHSDKL